MADVSYVAGTPPVEANPTTGFTVIIPTVEVGDLLVLDFTHGADADGSVTDDDTGGETWTLKGGGAFFSSLGFIRQYYKRATSATSGKTITVTGLSVSASGSLTVYRDAVATGDPFEAWTFEANGSGDETHASITTLTDGAMVCLVVAQIDNLAVATQSTTSPGTLTERVEHLSLGGPDSAIAHASEMKATAGATGSLTWTQVNTSSGSIAFAIAAATVAPADARSKQNIVSQAVKRAGSW